MVFGPHPSIVWHGISVSFITKEPRVKFFPQTAYSGLTKIQNRYYHYTRHLKCFQILPIGSLQHLM